MPTPKRNRSAPAATPKPPRGGARPSPERPRKPGLFAPALALIVGGGAAYFALAACGKAGDPPQPGGSPSFRQHSVLGAGELGPSPVGSGILDPSDGGANNLVAIPADAFVDDAGADDKSKGPMLGAAHFMTFVFEKPDFSSTRLGYLRAGAKVSIAGAVTGEPVKRLKTPSCKEGWVTIEPRGFVCLDKGGGSLNLEAPTVRLATAPPNFDDLLPYKYAFNWRNGAPLYRKVPTRDVWLEKEPWLKPAPKKAKPKKDDDDSPYGETEPKSDAPEKSDLDVEAGAAASDDLSDAGATQVEAGPWWERDAGKGEITLKDTIEGEGIVARRMAKGFAIAIDRTFAWAGRTWYRTTMGLVAPADSVSIVKASEFKGVELGGDWQLPLAFTQQNAVVFETKDKKSFKATKDRLKRQTPVHLLAPTAGYEEVKQGGFTFLPTADGHWIRASDVTKVERVAPPAEVKPGEKWIDVSIKGQWLVAYEGDKPVFTTLVSTGRDGTNEKGKFATVQGSFRVREKHVAATMDGDTAGELYSIEDVPYIQYFHTSYALHGAFWHSDFGRVRSHGCVNLSPLDAKRLFFWTEPRLPQGWHAVWATDADPGTLVVTRP